MSLGLKDLKKNRKESKISEKINETTEETSSISKKKVLRPWESFDQLVDQTRTLRAKEAVIKAIERSSISHPQIPLPASVEPSLSLPEEKFLSPELSLTPIWKKKGPAGPLHLFFYFLKM